MREWILNSGKQVVLWLSVLIFGFFSIVSLISTTYFNTGTSFAEHPGYRTDNLLLNLLILAVFLGILYGIRRKLDVEKIPIRLLAVMAVIFVTAISILWVRVSYTYPEADQKAVSWVAYLMSQNNYLFFEHGKYMQIYPNQLGLSAILEVLYRISGGENWRAFMYLTALANGAVVYLLYKITDRLFGKKLITALVLILSAGCVQIWLYTTFLYGIALGLALSLAAFLFLMFFLDKGKIAYGVISAFLIGAAILVKNNYSIVLVAMVILLLYQALEQKKLRPLILSVVLILIVGIMNKGLTAVYESRSGMTISSGMPKTLWIAMGMQEGERAEGWYNEFNYNTFLETDCDAKESDAIARESIRKSLENFRENPGYALRFYYYKTVSQWNEPTYEALWVNQFHSGDFSRIVQSIYDGKLYAVLHEYMNLYQSLIFAAVFLCLLCRRKSWNLKQLFLILVILGGFFFHTLWEAKSQYIFPYFVMMLPYGAAGIAQVLEWNPKESK